MFRQTGPGKAGTYPDPVFFDCIVYNFDIEGFIPKPEHTSFLDKFIIPKVRGGWSFIIQGTASRTGSNIYDLRLSQLRATKVYDYIEERLQRTLPNLSKEAIGKNHPIGKENEAELDRGVRIYGWNQPLRPPVPKPRPQAPPRPVPQIGPFIPPDPEGPTIEFFIKMTAGISIGPRIVQGEWQRFLLWDKIHGKAAFFDRFAGGAGVPVPLPGSFTQEGEFNRFVLHKPIPPLSLNDLDGSATIFTSRGTADVGVTVFTIKPFGPLDSREIVIDPFKTGFSWGFSFQTGSVGNFMMDKDRGIFDRKG